MIHECIKRNDCNEINVGSKSSTHTFTNMFIKIIHRTPGVSGACAKACVVRVCMSS